MFATMSQARKGKARLLASSECGAHWRGTGEALVVLSRAGNGTTARCWPQGIRVSGSRKRSGARTSGLTHRGHTRVSPTPSRRRERRGRLRRSRSCGPVSEGARGAREGPERLGGAPDSKIHRRRGPGARAAGTRRTTPRGRGAVARSAVKTNMGVGWGGEGGSTPGPGERRLTGTLRGTPAPYTRPTPDHPRRHSPHPAPRPDPGMSSACAPRGGARRQGFGEPCGAGAIPARQGGGAGKERGRGRAMAEGKLERG